MRNRRLLSRVRKIAVDFIILASILGILGLVAMTFYIAGAVHTAKEYAFILDTFEDNVKLGNTFYLNGIKVIPSGKGRVIAKYSPREIAEIQEARNATMDRVTGIPFAHLLD